MVERKTQDEKKAPAPKKAATDEVHVIKYMGTSHVFVLPKGDQIGGELPSGTPNEVRWDIETHHIAEVSGWSEAQLSALLDCQETDPHNPTKTFKVFLDVTDKERVPASKGQVMWRGAKSTIGITQDLPRQDTDFEVINSGGGVSTGADVTAEPSTADPAVST